MNYKEIILKVIDHMKNKGETPTKKGIATFLEMVLDRSNTYFLSIIDEMNLQIEEGV